MIKFSFPLEIGLDASKDHTVFGITRNHMFIFDPKRSDCGRFEVDPLVTYGITADEADNLNKLNAALDEATEAAINEGCRILQAAMSVVHGDAAGLFFSDSDKRNAIAKVFAEYVEFERQHG